MGRLGSFFNYYSTKNATGGVKNFSPLHFTWMLFTILLMLVIILVFRRLTNEKKDKILKISACLVLFLYLFRVFWALSIGKFSPDSMLPFHLCALMVIVDFIGVFWDVRLLKEFGYSAGLPGAFMAYLTPDINGYPLLSIQYQVYIFDHFFLMLIPLLMVFGNRYRPSKNYCNKVISIMAILALIDGFVNQILHSNYMFVSKAPPNTPFVIVQNHVGYLGYLIFIVGSTILSIKLMYLPWKTIRE